MSMRTNKEISGRMPGGYPPGIHADTRPEPEGDMNDGLELEESLFEGELIPVVSVPIVKLPEQAKEYPPKIELDCTVPEIHRQSTLDLSVPILRLRPGSITMSKVVLDDHIHSISKEDVHFYVPVVSLQQSAPVLHNTWTECASNVQEHWVTTYATLREQTSADSEDTEETPETTSPDSPSGGGAGIPEEPPDVMQYLFGIKNDDLSTRRPKIILYKERPEDNTLASFETCCLRIYREQVGGDPRLQPVSGLDETIVTYLDKWADPGRHLITLDLDYFSQEEAKKWFGPKNLRDFLRRAIAADYGFIIFKSRREDLFENCRLLVQERLASEIGHLLDIHVVKPNSLSIDKKRWLSSIFWGNCARVKEEPPVIAHYRDGGSRGTHISSYDLDVVFNKKCRAEYEKVFTSFTRGENRLYQIVTKKRSRESDEHYLMKCYVVRYLSEKYQLKTITEIRKAIHTEKPQESSSSPELFIPDVFDKKGNGYYEIETLFAGDRNGKELINHLSETVLKYELDRNKPARVYVVIDNTAAIRHMSDLLWLEEMFCDLEGVQVKFLTFDIASKGLIPIQEVNQKMQKVMCDKALRSSIFGKV
jgi:hypothetical protein